MKIIVALGNPGPEYAKTRHNIGWQAIDFFLEQKQMLWKKKFSGEYGELLIGQEKVGMLRPLTYMNKSGQAVREAITFYKIAPQDILVLHDELDFEYGKIAFKSGGGSAGHNGIKSIEQEIGSSQFMRLRLGIGRPARQDPAVYVLRPFSIEEMKTFNDYLIFCSLALTCFFQDGPTKASNQFNGKFFHTR